MMYTFYHDEHLRSIPLVATGTVAVAGGGIDVGATDAGAVGGEDTAATDAV